MTDFISAGNAVISVVVLGGTENCKTKQVRENGDVDVKWVRRNSVNVTRTRPGERTTSFLAENYRIHPILSIRR
jgi:hypothetical protein